MIRYFTLELRIPLENTILHHKMADSTKSEGIGSVALDFGFHLS